MISRDSWRSTRLEDLSTEEILRLFETETAHDSGATALTFRYRIGSALGRYEGMHRDRPHVLDLMGDRAVLVRLLLADLSWRSGELVSRGELIRLRQALGAFVAWLPLPSGVTRGDLRDVLAAARDAAMDVRGLRKVTRGGRSPEADKRHVPTAREIERVLADLRSGEDPLGDMTADLIAVCYLTGARAKAVLDLGREDLVQGSDGRRWLMIWEKARPDRRLLLARADRPSLFGEWMDLPLGEPLWQKDGRRLNKKVAAYRLRRACERTGVPDFTFHRLRNAFASHTARYMGLRTQRAGGWLAEQMAELYMGTPAGGPP